MSWEPEIEELRRREALAKQMGGSLNRLRSPFRTAEAFGIEEIIDPRDTRHLLTEWVAPAYENEATRLGPKFRGMRP